MTADPPPRSEKCETCELTWRLGESPTYAHVQELHQQKAALERALSEARQLVYEAYNEWRVNVPHWGRRAEALLARRTEGAESIPHAGKGRTDGKAPEQGDRAP
jgi:hypothetical protein